MKVEQLMALYGENAHLLDELYKEYTDSPSTLSPEWVQFFRELDKNGSYPSNGNGTSNGHKIPEILTASENEADLNSFEQLGIINLLNAYRRQGHLAANVDPLGIHVPDRTFIDQKLNSLPAGEMDMVIDSNIDGIGKTTVQELVEWFEKIYCGPIGSEHYYLVNDEEREWLQNKMESPAFWEDLDKGTRLRLYEKLFQADHFESFLAKKYVGKKRFSLEGGESLIPMLDTIIEEAGLHQMNGLVLGMAHRGRLNVLVNTIQKPAGLIFAEFEENLDPNSLDYGDVKYHLGYSSKLMTRAGKEVSLSLMFNPSHLEAVDPVVVGSVRARQEQYNDTDRTKYMGVTIHGDAAFMGQGVVAETFNLMNLEGYTTGGTFHIVLNNQIGFTTLPDESRSTLYATDLAKGFQIPIFHVNGDDPEALFRVVKLGMEYRNKFHKDFIIDLVCYRRLGHNEMDEPAFTQPKMYNIIKKHKPTVKLYEQKLLADGDITKEEIDFIRNGSMEGLEDSFRKAKEQDVKMKVDTMQGVWANYSKDPLDSEPATTLLKDQMDGIVEALVNTPEGFTPNPKLVKLLDERKKMAAGEIGIDWGFAEGLSLGSILENGFRVRLSGQDSQRGTFSHRHAVLVDINTGDKYLGLNHISDSQAKCEMINAALSEFSILGYEYGYSLSDPNSLVLWESQFGDFANNAQVIFDQFISSSEVKWQRLSGLTVLLPHGYEGQGPEHSSARLERYLQLCASNNMQVCICTTSAQYFHLLRRQMLRNYRKPLIILTPKSLLRYKDSCSYVDEFVQGAFQDVLSDSNVDPKNVEKIIFCTGKVYYDLEKYRKEKDLQKNAIVRIEQLYPFPGKDIQKVLKEFPKAKSFVWCQEEPKNQGAWYFIREHMEELLPDGIRLKYAGRVASPSPAAGHLKIHLKEQEQLVQDAHTL